MSETIEAGWVAGPTVAEIAVNSIHPVKVGKSSYIVVNVANELSAFRNACAHAGMPLDAATLLPDQGVIICPWHDWCYNAKTGDCFTLPAITLDTVPLRVEEGTVWLQVVT